MQTRQTNELATGFFNRFALEIIQLNYLYVELPGTEFHDTYIKISLPGHCKNGNKFILTINRVKNGKATIKSRGI